MPSTESSGGGASLYALRVEINPEEEMPPLTIEINSL